MTETPTFKQVRLSDHSMRVLLNHAIGLPEGDPVRGVVDLLATRFERAPVLPALAEPEEEERPPNPGMVKIDGTWRYALERDRLAARRRAYRESKKRRQDRSAA